MRKLTKKMSLNNATTLYNSLQGNTVLYAVLGKSNDWNNEPNPDDIVLSIADIDYDIKRNFIGGKRIDNVSFAVNRYNWTTNTVYAMYDDTDAELYDKNFYVVHESNVYKCLFNNGGAVSTEAPRGRDVDGVEKRDDGYIWKFMYSISAGDSDLYTTPEYIPVRTLTTDYGTLQWDVQQMAVDGGLDIIKINNGGSGYTMTENLTVSEANSSTLTLSSSGSSNPSPENDFYTGASVYISAVDGGGQVRRITDYNSTTKVLTVNKTFDPTPGDGAIVVISPTVTLIGDGQGCAAYSRVDSNGSISEINVISTGNGYTRAEAIISANNSYGQGANTKVIIPPAGGHGKDATAELGGDKLVFNIQFPGQIGNANTGAGYIPTGNSTSTDAEFRTISILKNPTLRVDENNLARTNPAVANSSNSPVYLRMTSRAKISYIGGMATDNPIVKDDILTNKSRLLDARSGDLEFVTELSSTVRADTALANSTKASNGHVVFIADDATETDESFFVCYLNNVNAYGDYTPFTSDTVLLKTNDITESDIAVVEEYKEPEAEIYSGEILYTEHLSAAIRRTNQTDDIKIVLKM